MTVASATANVNLKTEDFEHHGSTVNVDKYTLGDGLPTKQLAELALRPRSIAKLQPAYSLRRLTTDDRDDVIKFLRRFFFLDEPMNQAVGLLETVDSRCIELENCAAFNLEYGVSVAAVDEDGLLVGVILNRIVTREEAAQFEDKSKDCQNSKFRRILQVISHLESEGRPWDKLPKSCQSVMEIRIASTHSAWRGRGLMKVLCEESERLARDLGASALRMHTSSAFSAKAAEKLGYEKTYSVAYKDLTFAPQPDPPHLEARTYLKKL